MEFSPTSVGPDLLTGSCRTDHPSGDEHQNPKPGEWISEKSLSRLFCLEGAVLLQMFHLFSDCLHGAVQISESISNLTIHKLAGRVSSYWMHVQQHLYVDLSDITFSLTAPRAQLRRRESISHSHINILICDL